MSELDKELSIFRNMILDLEDPLRSMMYLQFIKVFSIISASLFNQAQNLKIVEHSITDLELNNKLLQFDNELLRDNR